jgi:hypothetical protein
MISMSRTCPEVTTCHDQRNIFLMKFFALLSGILTDKVTGEVYQADQILDSNDLLTIATISKSVYLLSNYVNW